MGARHLLRILRSPTAALDRQVREHPRSSTLRLGRERICVLAHPDLVHEVFALRGRSTRKGRALEIIRTVLGDGLLTSEGDLHRTQRRLIQPALHGERIMSYGATMRAAAEEVADRWTAGTTVDMAAEMSGLTLTIVSRVLFGARLADDDVREVADCLRVLLGGPPWHLVPGAGRLAESRGRRRAIERLDRLIRRLVGGATDASLVGFLRRTEMGERQVRDEALTLLLAGHETTATALTWSWHLLAGHSCKFGAGEVPARAVVAEAMRLYPPSWILGRRLLEPLEVDGVRLEEGTLVVASQWTLHRDARFWSDPLEFRPGRWLDGDGRFDLSAPGQPRWAYLPFGLGSRVCIGREFAWTEAEIILETLGSGWDPRAADDSPVRPKPSITLRPHHGLPMVLDPR